MSHQVNRTGIGISETATQRRRREGQGLTTCNPVEEVVADYWFEEQTEDGTKTIHAFLIDGRSLMITKPNPAKLAELKKAEQMMGRHVPRVNRDDDEPTSSQNQED